MADIQSKKWKTPWRKKKHDTSMGSYPPNEREAKMLLGTQGLQRYVIR